MKTIDINKTRASKLREIRKLNEYTVEKVSAMTGVSINNIKKCENVDESTSVDDNIVYTLAKYYNVSMDWIYSIKK